MSSTQASLQGNDSSTLTNAILTILVLVILGVLYNFYQLGIKVNQDRQYVETATEIQILAQEVATLANQATTGRIEAFEDLAVKRNRLNSALGELENGDGISLPPAPAAAQEALVDTRNAWSGSSGGNESMSDAIEVVLSSQDQVINANFDAEDFGAVIPQLQASLDEVSQILVENNAPPEQLYVASRQMVLADRMLRHINDILGGGFEATTAASGLSRDSQHFGRDLDSLLNGAEDGSIPPIQDSEALEILGTVYSDYNEIREMAQSIMDASADLYEVGTRADTVLEDSQILTERAENLAESFRNLGQQRTFPSLTAGLVGAGVAVLLIILMLFLMSRGTRERYAQTSELNQRNQEAILRLLDEMGSLAEGDLTVRATVTEDITGAIADSINFAIEALRNLVTTINETAVQVSSAAQETQATATHLAEAAEHQAQQITSASAAINEIAVSIDEVSKNSAESADVAQRSVQIATKGAQVVRETIEGMDNIRENIQDTSKRIKRLGESSQEIGDIVELINDIAEQTNILALNAAIQAASAGEAGRGFAVVADEVQRLAERASNATKRIETLVQTIQADTNEAVISMEQTTSQVVSGARLAENAGEALGEIESVSNDLADLIQNISEASRQQSAAATNISGTMNVIQEITTQTSSGTTQTAESIGHLAELASDLRKSVADFKLPA